MATLKISLDYDPDVFEITSDNKLAVKISAASGNTLKCDSTNNYGLYAYAPKGENGTSGSGYQPGDGYEGIKVGYANPFSSSQSTDAAIKKRVMGSLTIHRTWISDGKDSDGFYKLKNFRSNLDYVMPGDIVKIDSSYYVITSVTTPSDMQAPGNKISTVAKISV